MTHITLGKWADLFLIAPATANTINKIAVGIADSLLLSSFLAFNGKKILAPAANTQMLENPITQESLRRLEALGMGIIESATKELACGDVGKGALAEPMEIVYCVTRALLEDSFWCDRRVVVSGGGSRESLDSVRYLTNRSSGKMAEALALALYYRGARVLLVSSKPSAHLPQGIDYCGVESAQDYLEVLCAWQREVAEAPKTPYLFMAAAISDYRLANPAQGKLKKEQIGSVWNLALEQTPDVLKSLQKGQCRIVGFKLETSQEGAFERAHSLITSKGVDAVCLNIIDEENPFGASSNEVTFITPSGCVELAKDSKLSIAFRILEEAQTLA